MVIHQAHEKKQCHNEGNGGAVGLMQNQDYRCRWTVPGPEMSGVIDEFENAMEFSSKCVSENRQHELNS